MNTKFIASQFITIIMTVIMYVGLFQGDITCYNIVKTYTLIVFIILIISSFCLKEHERSYKYIFKYQDISNLLWGVTHCLMFFVAKEYTLMLMDGYITYFVITNGNYNKE